MRRGLRGPFARPAPARFSVSRYAPSVRAVGVSGAVLAVVLALPGFSQPEPITHTAHVFNVHGHWTWVIGAGDFPAYAAGTCPGPAT